MRHTSHITCRQSSTFGKWGGAKTSKHIGQDTVCSTASANRVAIVQDTLWSVVSDFVAVALLFTVDIVQLDVVKLQVIMLSNKQVYTKLLWPRVLIANSTAVQVKMIFHVLFVCSPVYCASPAGKR